MTQQPGPVIVPLDGSVDAENAIGAAKTLAAYFGAPLVFIHVVDPDDVPTGTDFAQAREVFGNHITEMTAREGIANATAHTAEGKPAPTILRYAREHQASAIVIASHGRGGFQAAFVGSVADKVARGGECPVLIVPAVKESAIHSPVLIAVDGSAGADAALATGRAVARHLAAEVAIVSAYRMPPPVGVEFSYYSPTMVDSFREATEKYLQDTCQGDEKGYAAQGSPAMVIVETANQLDAGLVVMASTGKGLAERLAFGSTTERVMHGLHRPLLIVRSEA
jgi:nucleotide-binding universal stress UspA family protein